MSCLWFLSLLYALISLQSSASSEEGVSLNCNKTVVVVAGEPVTLNCTIVISCYSCSDCKGFRYSWKTTTEAIPFDSDKYNCKWDNENYVSLTIPAVEKDENYTIKIYTDCGTANSTIKVEVTDTNNSSITATATNQDVPAATTHHVTAALCVIFFTVVLGILCFLFGTGRCRKRTPGHTNLDIDHAGTACLA